MSALPEHANPPRQLRPPQFGLRTLLGLVTLCGALLALGQWLHPAAVALIAFFAVSIFCHVAGNALGTRLRQIGDLPAADTPLQVPKTRPHHFAPATVLSRRERLGWVVLAATSVGVLSGAIGGGFWTFLVASAPPDAPTIAIGVIAFAVLGGLATFVTMGFTKVLFTALRQALTTTSPTCPPDTKAES